MDAIITTKHLTKRFNALVAVDRLNLEVFRGEIFGLVGPDGAGKTTTLRMLCGLMDPSGGEVTVAEYNPARQPQELRQRIGYMAQRFGLYSDLTVDENMGFYSDLFGVSKAQRAELLPDLLRMTRMEPFRKRAAGHLSGGMRQKLALMCTLLHRPQILFLDEPTNGVDPVSRRDFWAILYQLVQSGITVFITTAYLDEAERCNRLALINHGRIIECDSPEALRRGLEEGCYEVRGPDHRAIRQVLQDCDGVLSVEPFGATLHVFLKSSLTSPGALMQKLDDGGVGPAIFKKITPSLEDVFIALIGISGDRPNEEQPDKKREQ